jgi:TRAP-type C4-dicarboxylate transport system substrate-binding protein
MKRRFALIALLLTALAATSASARSVLKLATLVPDGSVWHESLMEMGATWKADTGGSGNLRVYAGGVAGDEPDMLRKMRTGQLQAATLTVSGLTKLDGAFGVFTMPLFYDSYDELWHVADTLEPTLRERLDERGYVLLNWGLGGWIHIFSKKPIHRVEDLRGVKMFASAGDDDWVQLWKNRGYAPVPLAMTDIQTGLQTGLIDGIPTTPLASLSLQWFRHVPHMYETGLAPLIGATIVTKAAWKRMSESERDALVEAAKTLEARLRREVPQQDAQAVEEMKKRGLEVTSASDDPAAEAAWNRESRALSDYMRANMVPTDIFDRAVRARDAYRKEHATP